MTLSKFVEGIFCDKNATPSSKRVMTFMAFLMFVQAFEMNVYRAKLVDENLMSIIQMMVLAGMGITTFENVATRKAKPEDKPVV